MNRSEMSAPSNLDVAFAGCIAGRRTYYQTASWTPGHDRLAGDSSAPSLWQVNIWALTGLAHCVPQLAARATASAVATARQQRKENATAESSARDKNDAGC